jgi:hypothetical protein
MAKQYTVLFIDDKGAPVKESRITTHSIRCITALAIIILGILAAGTHRYIRMQGALADKVTLLSRIDQQKNAIDRQHHQIKNFAFEINDLKSSLRKLNDFENKIRIIANLEQKTDQASLFAVGGSMPEDLDPNLARNRDHDRLVREMHGQMKTVQQASSLQHDNFTSLLNHCRANAIYWPPLHRFAPQQVGYLQDLDIVCRHLPAAKSFTKDWILPREKGLRS